MTDQELKQRTHKIENEIRFFSPTLDYKLVWKDETPVIQLNESVTPELEKQLLQIAIVSLPLS